MKKKLLLLIIRLIRLFKSEDRFIPNLRAVPDGKVKTVCMYRYYGRILVSRPWTGSVVTYYELDEKAGWKPCSEVRYNEVRQVKGEAYVNLSAENTACNRCACRNLSLPCRCDFSEGSFNGYYELVHQDKQYSDNINL